MHYKLGSIGLAFRPFKEMEKQIVSLAKTIKHNFWLIHDSYRAEDIFNIDLQLKLWSIDWQCANNEE